VVSEANLANPAGELIPRRSKTGRGRRSQRSSLGWSCRRRRTRRRRTAVWSSASGLETAWYRWAAGEVSWWILFQRPPARTRRASSPATGSPAIVTGESWQARTRHHAGHSLPDRRSALRIPPGIVMSDHLVCFALWTAFPPSLAGRDSCDYYQTSVAIGLASRRRSHVRPRCTYRAELRWPTHLLEYPHRVKPATRRLRQPMSDADAGHGTGSDVFPVDGGLHHWRLGFRQFSFHRIPRAPQHLAPVRLGATSAFLACSGPLHLSDPGKPSDPRTSLRVPPG